MHPSDRRARGDLIGTFKIASDIYDLGKEDFFEFDTGGRRGHSKKSYLRKGVDWTLKSTHLVTE